MTEVEEAYRILQAIAAGEGTTVAEHNLRRKGEVGASSRGLDGMDWRMWKGWINTNCVTMLGHSSFWCSNYSGDPASQ